MPRSISNRKILVVDDDQGLLVLMAESLRSEGYLVSTASSGADLVDRLRNDPPELMILDLKLKDTTGQALLERLQREGLGVPFIIVTGQGDEAVAVQMMRQGALDYVSKVTGLIDLLPGVVARALVAVDRERALVTERSERQRLEREVIEVAERERRRIGEDLHDSLGQQLTAIEILCAGLKADIAKDPKLAKQADRIATLLRESIAQVRALARGLVPVTEEPDALWASLIELAEQTNALGRAECRLDCPGMILVSDSTVAGQLYRIAQEAVNNAVKHSRAKKIVIAFSRNDGALDLSVTDNGRGFTESPARGMGLKVMQHRAQVIGAELKVETKPGGGTLIACRLREAK